MDKSQSDSHSYDPRRAPNDGPGMHDFYERYGVDGPSYHNHQERANANMIYRKMVEDEEADIRRKELDQETPAPKAEPASTSNLTINTPGDKFEQEADTLADKVVGTSSSKSKSSTIAGKVPSVQAKGDVTTPPTGFGSRLNTTKGGGEPLSDDFKSTVEGQTGKDLSNVRVHTDNNAAEMAKDVSAKAFTHGTDIYGPKENLSEGSSDGKHTLAHEVGHTIQQSQGTAAGSIQRTKDDPSPEKRAKLLRSFNDLTGERGFSKPGMSLVKSMPTRKLKKYWDSVFAEYFVDFRIHNEGGVPYTWDQLVASDYYETEGRYSIIYTPIFERNLDPLPSGENTDNPPVTPAPMVDQPSSAEGPPKVPTEPLVLMEEVVMGPAEENQTKEEHEKELNNQVPDPAQVEFTVEFVEEYAPDPEGDTVVHPEIDPLKAFTDEQKDEFKWDEVLPIFEALHEGQQIGEKTLKQWARKWIMYGGEINDEGFPNKPIPNIEKVIVTEHPENGQKIIEAYSFEQAWIEAGRQGLRRDVGDQFYWRRKITGTTTHQNYNFAPPNVWYNKKNLDIKQKRYYAKLLNKIITDAEDTDTPAGGVQSIGQLAVKGSRKFSSEWMEVLQEDGYGKNFAAYVQKAQMFLSHDKDKANGKLTPEWIAEFEQKSLDIDSSRKAAREKHAEELAAYEAKWAVPEKESDVWTKIGSNENRFNVLGQKTAWRYQWGDYDKEYTIDMNKVQAVEDMSASDSGMDSAIYEMEPHDIFKLSFRSRVKALINLSTGTAVPESDENSIVELLEYCPWHQRDRLSKVLQSDYKLSTDRTIYEQLRYAVRHYKLIYWMNNLMADRYGIVDQDDIENFETHVEGGTDWNTDDMIYYLPRAAMRELEYRESSPEYDRKTGRRLLDKNKSLIRIKALWVLANDYEVGDYDEESITRLLTLLPYEEKVARQVKREIAYEFVKTSVTKNAFGQAIKYNPMGLLIKLHDITHTKQSDLSDAIDKIMYENGDLVAKFLMRELKEDTWQTWEMEDFTDYVSQEVYKFMSVASRIKLIFKIQEGTYTDGWNEESIIQILKSFGAALPKVPTNPDSNLTEDEQIKANIQAAMEMEASGEKNRILIRQLVYSYLFGSDKSTALTKLKIVLGEMSNSEWDDIEDFEFTSADLLGDFQLDNHTQVVRELNDMNHEYWGDLDVTDPEDKSTLLGQMRSTSLERSQRRTAIRSMPLALIQQMNVDDRKLALTLLLNMDSDQIYRDWIWTGDPGEQQINAILKYTPASQAEDLVTWLFEKSGGYTIDDNDRIRMNMILSAVDGAEADELHKAFEKLTRTQFIGSINADVDIDDLKERAKVAAEAEDFETYIEVHAEILMYQLGISAALDVEDERQEELREAQLRSTNVIPYQYQGFFEGDDEEFYIYGELVHIDGKPKVRVTLDNDSEESTYYDDWFNDYEQFFDPTEMVGVYFFEDEPDLGGKAGQVTLMPALNLIRITDVSTTRLIWEWVDIASMLIGGVRLLKGGLSLIGKIIATLDVALSSASLYVNSHLDELGPDFVEIFRIIEIAGGIVSLADLVGGASDASKAVSRFRRAVKEAADLGKIDAETLQMLETLNLVMESQMQMVRRIENATPEELIDILKVLDDSDIPADAYAKIAKFAKAKLLAVDDAALQVRIADDLADLTRRTDAANDAARVADDAVPIISENAFTVIIGNTGQGKFKFKFRSEAEYKAFREALSANGGRFVDATESGIDPKMHPWFFRADGTIRNADILEDARYFDDVGNPQPFHKIFQAADDVTTNKAWEQAMLAGRYFPEGVNPNLLENASAMARIKSILEGSYLGAKAQDLLDLSKTLAARYLNLMRIVAGKEQWAKLHKKLTDLFNRFLTRMSEMGGSLADSPELFWKALKEWNPLRVVVTKALNGDELAVSGLHFSSFSAHYRSVRTSAAIERSVARFGEFADVPELSRLRSYVKTLSEGANTDLLAKATTLLNRLELAAAQGEDVNLIATRVNNILKTIDSSGVDDAIKLNNTISFLGRINKMLGAGETISDTLLDITKIMDKVIGSGLEMPAVVGLVGRFGNGYMNPKDLKWWTKVLETFPDDPKVWETVNELLINPNSKLKRFVGTDDWKLFMKAWEDVSDVSGVIGRKIDDALASAKPEEALEGTVADWVRNQIVSFQRKIPPKTGSIGEIDIELADLMIEVTVATKGKLAQIKNYISLKEINPLGKKIILYAPNYGWRAARDIKNAGAHVARTKSELLDLITELRSIN